MLQLWRVPWGGRETGERVADLARVSVAERRDEDILSVWEERATRAAEGERAKSWAVLGRGEVCWCLIYWASNTKPGKEVCA